MNKSTSWRITQSWYILFTFVIFLHWLGIFIAGKRAANRKWVLWGLIHSIPVGVLFLTIPEKLLQGYPFFENLLMVAFFISWFGAIIQAFVIRNEFLILLEARLNNSHAEMHNLRASIIEQSSKENKNKDIIAQAESLKSEIAEILKEKNSRAELYRDEVLPMVNEYTSQIDDLLKHEEKLENTKQSLSKVFDAEKLNEYKHKMQKAESSAMRREYESAYKQMQKAERIMKDLDQQLETCKLRIEASILSLNELKISLIVLANKDDDVERFIADVQLKSTELREYINLLAEDAKQKEIL